MSKNCKQKLLIVQPHSDDILFSCSGFLFLPNYEVEVLTIENNKKRIAEDTKLFDFLQIPFYHLNVDYDDESYYAYHNTYKKTELTVEKAYNCLIDCCGRDILDEFEQQIEEFLTKYKKSHKDFIVVSPWGIGHPFHLFVREIIQRNISNLWYYREFPHSFKRMAKEQVANQLNDYKLIQKIPIEDFADIKWSLGKKFYKTQSSMFFYEKGYMDKNIPEEIYVRKDQELPF